MNHQLRLLSGFMLILGAYVATNILTVKAVPALYNIPCTLSFLTTTCRYGQDHVGSPLPYAVLGGFVLSMMIAMRVIWKNSTSYVFIALFGYIGLFTIGYDLIVQRPIINGEKVINDTVNILAAVIASSFILLLIIMRNVSFRLGPLLMAIIKSFGAKMLAIVGFIGISKGVYGATELLLLYIVYAFGAFTMHLMTVCTFVAKVVPQAQEAKA